MQKKIIALAVAAAFSAPAFAADTADFTVYGKAFLTVDSVKSDIAPANTKTSTTGVNSNASRLGFKGSEDLGDGLKAVYQYELEMAAAGGTGLSATRNSGVGLDGGFGKVILGNWDTPFKVVHNKLELFDNTTVYTALNLIGHSGTGNNYNTRQAKMIQYWSPKVGGLQAAVMYSPDTNTSTLATAKNTSRLSMSATYDQDALYAAVGFESRPDQTTVGKSDSGVRLAAMYSLGDAALGAMAERLTIQGAATSVSQTNMEFVGKYKLDKNVFALSVAKAGNVGTAATTGATQLSLRLGHNFSKRTELFAAYTSLKNDTNNGAYSLSTVFAAQAGSKQSAMGVGLTHSF